MTVRAIAWDIDGTLIESEPLHLTSLMAVARAHGVDLSDLPDDRFVGVGLDGVWQAIGDRFPADLTVGAWVDAINAHYVGHRDRLPIAPRVPALLARIAAAGLPQVAVSNSHRCIVDANLDALNVGTLLAFSLSLDDVPAGKPDPAPYRLAAARLGLPPGEVLVVEDSAAGLASGRAAGCRTVGLAARGAAWPEADHTVHGLEEIPGLIAVLGTWLPVMPNNQKSGSGQPPTQGKERPCFG